MTYYFSDATFVELHLLFYNIYFNRLLIVVETVLHSFAEVGLPAALMA